MFTQRSACWFRGLIPQCPFLDGCKLFVRSVLCSTWVGLRLLQTSYGNLLITVGSLFTRHHRSSVMPEQAVSGAGKWSFSHGGYRFDKKFALTTWLVYLASSSHKGMVVSELTVQFFVRDFTPQSFVRYSGL
mmetsp:Transcript_56145/g.111582  ORF Transcript_56145/g.111582 Transcript_56145/m.111582 type:complete len:132 (-) Transcript_56145:21-416(-)